MTTTHSAQRPSGQRRKASVLATCAITPHMRRITLCGPDVDSFLDEDRVDAPAAWIKIFVPAAAGGSIGRAYTIRRIDRTARSFDVDFVVHGDGPAGRWAAHAAPGAQIEFAGPRGGGFALLPSTRWLLLVGDASALPAIHSLLTRVPAALRVFAVIAIDDVHEQQVLHSAAELSATWLVRAQHDRILSALDTIAAAQATESGQAWIAGEAAMVRDVRNYCLEHIGMERAKVSGKGYWKHGESDYRSPDD
ncbi:MAG: siderophore-interacting protein [Rudaea sp.]|uniref:siderophore-interacting protein n=1 Tax=unclassified Rudaea TaxID=2627037 RepID=UPI0010FA50F3|nr:MULTISPECIES: siderophore-interacting protein [unclassified Rudaea]MBN8886434.1 siderophore-interacting protein [Rudaea sp.]